MSRTLISIFLSVAIVLSVWGLMPTSIALAADNDIVISEVVFNSTCQGTVDTTCGTGSNEDHFEWVEIYNKGVTAVNLNGWSICDLGGTLGCDTLPNQTVQPGEYWIIAYNTTALQTEFNQYTPVHAVNPARTISLNSPIGGGLRNSSAEGVYLVNSSAQDVTCVSWGDTNTLCSPRTTLGSKTDTAFQTANGQSITNIAGTWYRHGPTNGPQQASPYQSNTSTTGATSITLSEFTAVPNSAPQAAMLLALGLVAFGAILAIRRSPAA
jgi:hypothetical protein